MPNKLKENFDSSICSEKSTIQQNEYDPLVALKVKGKSKFSLVVPQGREEKDLEMWIKGQNNLEDILSDQGGNFVS